MRRAPLLPPNPGRSTAAAGVTVGLVALALGACAEAGMRLPQLRVRGWLTLSSTAGRAASVGGELGLVMPLDSVPSATLDAAAPDDVPEDASVEVARLEITGRAAQCRVVAACRWEDAARARALARAEGDGP